MGYGRIEKCIEEKQCNTQSFIRGLLDDLWSIDSYNKILPVSDNLHKIFPKVSHNKYKEEIRKRRGRECEYKDVLGYIHMNKVTNDTIWQLWFGNNMRHNADKTM